jgi:hypothetical protein
MGASRRLPNGSMVVTDNYLKVRIPPGRKRTQISDWRSLIGESFLIGDPPTSLNRQ